MEVSISCSISMLFPPSFSMRKEMETGRFRSSHLTAEQTRTREGQRECTVTTAFCGNQRNNGLSARIPTRQPEKKCMQSCVSTTQRNRSNDVNNVVVCKYVFNKQWMDKGERGRRY